MSIERYFRQISIVCDSCGKRISGGETWPEAMQARRDAGWETNKVAGEWTDTCNDCLFEAKGYDRDPEAQPDYEPKAQGPAP